MAARFFGRSAAQYHEPPASPPVGRLGVRCVHRRLGHGWGCWPFSSERWKNPKGITTTKKEEELHPTSRCLYLSFKVKPEIRLERLSIKQIYTRIFFPPFPSLSSPLSTLTRRLPFLILTHSKYPVFVFVFCSFFLSYFTMCGPRLPPFQRERSLQFSDSVWRFLWQVGGGVCVTRVEWIVLLLLKARCVYIYIRKRIYSSCLFTEKKKEDDCRVKRRPRAVTWEPKHSLLAYYLPAEKLRCQNALMIRQGQRDSLFSSSSSF